MWFLFFTFMRQKKKAKKKLASKKLLWQVVKKVNFRPCPHEIIPLVDEIVEDPLHRTSHSPNQGVAQFLSHPLNMAKPHFSLEWSQHGCDSPSPHGYDGRIIDRLGRTLRRQTSARCLDRRVPLLAHTLPGAQRRLPGTDSLSPPSQRVSCDCQDGQHGGGILHKSPRGFTVAHPEQACTPSSPLVSEQVPEQVDLFASQESSQFPGTSGHRHVCPSLAERETVHVSASKANSRSPVQGEGERCPSPTRSPILAISDVVLWADSHSVSAPLVDSDQAGPALSFRERSGILGPRSGSCGYGPSRATNLDF